MTLVHKIIDDSDTESLIAKYLKAGVMVRGEYEETKVGTNREDYAELGIILPTPFKRIRNEARVIY